MKFIEWTENGDAVIKLEADDLKKAICLGDPMEKIHFANEIIDLCVEHANDEEPEG